MIPGSGQKGRGVKGTEEKQRPKAVKAENGMVVERLSLA